MAGSSGDYASGILLWIRGIGVGVADRVFGDCAGSSAVPVDDDTVDGGEIQLCDCGGDVGDAGKNESAGLAVCSDGWIVGGVVCGGVDEDGIGHGDAEGTELKREECRSA